MLELGFGNLYFMIELLLGEFILFFFYPKKSVYWARLIILSFCACSLSLLIPESRELLMNPWYQIFRFSLMLVFSVIVMFMTYEVDLRVTISTCAAGYAVQHIFYHIILLIGQTNILSNYVGNQIISRGNMLEFIFYPIFYLLIFFTFGLFLKKKKFYERSSKSLTFTSIAIVVVILGVSRLARYFGESNNITGHLYAIISCVCLLFIQYGTFFFINISYENKLISELYDESKKRYELSKEAIDIIGIKYHDLKHRLNLLNDKISSDEIDEITNAMDLTKTVYKTNNHTLDILLFDESTKCLKEEITLSFNGDASSLDFMNEVDLYTMFANAVDNAIEAASMVKDKNKRIVQINVAQFGEIIKINIVNYFEGFIKIINGQLFTTKHEDQEYHGFGMKSIHRISKKYRGSVSFENKDDVFSLNIIIHNSK